MRSPLLLILSAGLAGVLTGGCDATETGQIEDLATEGMTKTMTLRFQRASGGGIALKASGKLLSCGALFDGLEGERVACKRDGESLQVIVKAEGDEVVAVRDLSRKRGYYTCSATGEVEGLPAEMKCQLTPLRPRGTGGLSSPFDSSVEGVTVPNTHEVGDRGLLRGMEPRTPEQFAELRAAGVERVLIFKNMTGDAQPSEEIEAWGFAEADALHVPFHWKDHASFTEPCEQTLEALRFLREGIAEERTTFFHCTVGEDRTGYLAAVHEVLFEGKDMREAFDLDMCERGYGAGNPQKPGYVLGKLEDAMLPLYRSMTWLIAQGALTQDLDPAVCATAPEVPEDHLPGLVCGTSTTLVP